MKKKNTTFIHEKKTQNKKNKTKQNQQKLHINKRKGKEKKKMGIYKCSANSVFFLEWIFPRVFGFKNINKIMK